MDQEHPAKALPPGMEAQLLESLFDGVYYVDTDRTILYWNPACESISGHRAEDVLGVHCCDTPIDHVDERGNHLCCDGCPLIEAIETGRHVAKKVYLHHAEGHRVAVETHVAPVTDGDGATIGAVEVFRDVTPVEELEDLRRDFASMIVHDLRNPASSAQIFAELLADGAVGPVTDDQKKALSRIRGATGRMLALIQDYLDLATIEARQLRLETTDFHVREPVIAALELMDVQAAAGNVAVSSNLPDGLPLVTGDPARLEQVLTNLLSNAVKFTPPGGSVTVSTAIASDGESVRVDVADTGPGIPEEELTLIFDKYRRASTGRAARQKGTGLGLTISKLIVDAHGGNIWATSRPGKGSTFSFTIPLAAP